MRGIALLRAGFKELDAAFSSYGLCMFLGELAEALGHIGQIAEALATVDEAIERSDRTEEGWISPSCCASRANCFDWAARRRPRIGQRVLSASATISENAGCAFLGIRVAQESGRGAQSWGSLR